MPVPPPCLGDCVPLYPKRCQVLWQGKIQSTSAAEQSCIYCETVNDLTSAVGELGYK